MYIHVSCDRNAASPLLARFPDGSFFFSNSEFIKSVELERKWVKETIQKRSRPIEGSKDLVYLHFSACESDGMMAKLTARMQALLLLFIDGSSIIDLLDSKWQVTWLFSSKSFHIMGFCSAYGFFKFPLGIRLRISQFFIMPYCQRTGYGSILYQQVMRLASTDARIHEVTVEDPNDEFSLLRLKNDRNLLDCKLNSMQRTEAELLNQYDQKFKDKDQDSKEFVEFKRAVKRFICKKFPDCIPLDRKDKIRVLNELFEQELARFNSLINCI